MKHSIMLCEFIGGTYVPVTSPFDCDDNFYNYIVKNTEFIVVELPKIVQK